MTGAVRFWVWVSCHGAVLCFMLLTSALPDGDIVPVTLLYCCVAGLLTGLWTGRAAGAGMVGGTTALIGAGAILLAAGVTHRSTLGAPWPLIVVALAVTLPAFAALGFTAGAVGGAIASPVETVRSAGRAAARGPAWRGLLVLSRIRPERRRQI